MIHMMIRALAVVPMLLVVGCGSPAQIGPDPEVFKTIDALYTAVSLRDPKLVDDCLKALTRHRDADKLPDDAFQALSAIIDEAGDGAWEDAQTRLSRFMLGQRRG